MKDAGELEDELPSEEDEAAEAEQELQPDLPYDPLIEPWNDPASTSTVEYRLSQRWEGETVRPSATPAHTALPYPRYDDLSELRHRLREGTVVVPRRRADRGGALGLVITGLVLLAISAPVIIWSSAAPPDAAYYINLAVMILGTFSLLYGISGLVFHIPVPSTRVEGEAAETLLLAVLIFFAIGGIPGRGGGTIQNFRVEGASMQPSLDSGEYLIVNKLTYAEIDLSIFDWLPFYDSGDDPVHHLWDSPSRGDVIVFRAPTNLSRDFIKRIIGVPGDTVEIDRDTNTVRLNGEIIEESYIQGETTCHTTCGPWIVPEEAYFVMGDNRQNSSDSRQGWFVPEENIIGKALITYWHDGSLDLDLAPNHKVSITGEAAAEE